MPNKENFFYELGGGWADKIASYVEGNNIEGAVNECEKMLGQGQYWPELTILETYPEIGRKLVERFEIYMDYRNAIKVVEMFGPRIYGDIGWKIKLGSLYMNVQVNRKREAKILFDEVVQDYPDNIEAHLGLAQIVEDSESKAEHYDKAVTELNRQTVQAKKHIADKEYANLNLKMVEREAQTEMEQKKKAVSQTDLDNKIATLSEFEDVFPEIRFEQALLYSVRPLDFEKLWQLDPEIEECSEYTKEMGRRTGIFGRFRKDKPVKVPKCAKEDSNNFRKRYHEEWSLDDVFDFWDGVGNRLKGCDIKKIDEMVGDLHFEFVGCKIINTEFVMRLYDKFFELCRFAEEHNLMEERGHTISSLRDNIKTIIEPHIKGILKKNPYELSTKDLEEHEDILILTGHKKTNIT